MVHEKNSRVSLRTQELYHPRDFLWILAVIPVCRNTDFPVPVCDSHFFGFGILVGLFNNSSDVSEENGSPRTVMIAGWWSVPDYGSPRTCLSTLSLDTIAGRWSEWSTSWLEGVVGVEVDELEEVVDKPGTTIGTKFSVLHCIRIPFLMSCVFWPLIHSYEYPCSSRNFPSDKTAGVSSRTSIVKNASNSLT